MLFVDESDLFKSLFFASKMSRIAGVPQTESNRAFDMYVKTQYMNRHFGEGRVVFATGTAISNSVSEIFTVQRYLQPALLRKHSLHHFDLWAHQFGEVVAMLELAPDGSGYRVNSRFARFLNVPELLSMFRQVADIVTQEQTVADVPLPEVVSGKPEVIAAEGCQELHDLIATLVSRVDLIKRGEVKPTEDNMLSVTNTGRQASLDIRLAITGAPDHSDSKVNLCVRKVFEIWEETKASRLTQMVFCDMSTPKDGFNIYDDMLSKLIKLGIPACEIAFMQSAKTDLMKRTLFDKVRCGSIRILFGSTETMGAGTDVQRLLYALHELDAPWRPRDILQREGRIQRQGNENPYIRIIRYITEGSFDQYIWQTLEVKARFITQFANADSTVRTSQDVDDLVLTYAEVKAIASGNPLVMEKFRVEQDLRELRMLHTQYLSGRYQMQAELAALPSEIGELNRSILAIASDIKMVEGGSTDALITIDGVRQHSITHAGEALFAFAASVRNSNEETYAGSYADFSIFVRPQSPGANPPGSLYEGTPPIPGASAQQGRVAQNIQETLQSMPKMLEQKKALLPIKNKRLADLQIEADKPFVHFGRIEELEGRLRSIDCALDLDRDRADTLSVEGKSIESA